VLKPVRSKVVVGSRLMTLPVTVVRDGAERAEILAAWLPFTAVQEQEWVPGRGFGVEMLYDRGTMAWHFAHERLHESPLTGGASTWRRSCATDSELIEPSRRLLDRLGWHGVAMIEWRCSQGSAPQLIEINPRLWGRCRSRSRRVSTFRWGCSRWRGTRRCRPRRHGAPACARATSQTTCNGSSTTRAPTSAIRCC
jgi:hypothetical protein